MATTSAATSKAASSQVRHVDPIPFSCFLLCFRLAIRHERANYPTLSIAPCQAERPHPADIDP
jgi:hypothetical protein